MEQQQQLVSDLDIEIKRLQVCYINPVWHGASTTASQWPWYRN